METQECAFGFTHCDNDAVAYCDLCGRPGCEQCGAETATSSGYRCLSCIEQSGGPVTLIEAEIAVRVHVRASERDLAVVA